MPRTFFLVLAVQFLSTLADNAFLIVAIARVMELAAQGWVVPVLKLGFTLFYVVLAPFVGPLADAIPKGRVMVLANAMKVVAVTLLLAGLDPVLVITLAGLGAAIYAPAKYGLITELLPASSLVKANGFFEGVTVSAVIFGTVLGGFLVGPSMPVWGPPAWLQLGVSMESTRLLAGMGCLLALHGVALLLSVGVPDTGARYATSTRRPLRLVMRFYRENLQLWRDPQGGVSMSVTTLLWGVGATLQLIVLRWASEALGLTLAQSAYLQGVTAAGVIAGAVLASYWVRIGDTLRLLPLGVLLGCLVPVLLAVDSVVGAALLLVLVGAIAGFFVVPMNALLQHRGCTLLTAGRSIAVQGFNENGGMLLMLALYAFATAAQLPLSVLLWGFGALIVACMLRIYQVARSQEESQQAQEGGI